MLRFTTVPVIALARSDAVKTATFVSSSSVVKRRVWVRLAIVA